MFFSWKWHDLAVVVGTGNYCVNWFDVLFFQGFAKRFFVNQSAKYAIITCFSTGLLLLFDNDIGERNWKRHFLLLEISIIQFNVNIESNWKLIFFLFLLLIGVINSFSSAKLVVILADQHFSIQPIINAADVCLNHYHYHSYHSYILLMAM